MLKLNIILLIISSVALADNVDFSNAAKKIKLQNDPAIESKYGKEEWFQAVKNWLTSQRNWEEVMKTIEARIGLYSKDGVYTVITWDEKFGDSPTAMGGTKDGNGTIQVTPRFLKAIPKNQWETVLKCTFAHEFTHVLQRSLTPNGTKGWTEWFREGMAIYAGGDAMTINSIMGYKAEQLTKLDIADTKPHPRGTLVFLYIREKFGEESIKKITNLVTIQNQSIEQSIGKATGMNWATFKEEEYKWSSEYLRKKR